MMVIGDCLKKYGRFIQKEKYGRDFEGFKRGFEGLGEGLEGFRGF